MDLGEFSFHFIVYYDMFYIFLCDIYLTSLFYDYV